MSGDLAVTVVYSPCPRTVEERELRLPQGTTVRQAVEASGFLALKPAVDLDSAGIGVWGRRTALDALLLNADRVEIYRPLKVDPKTARRERFRAQGSRAAGLFSMKRSGG